MADNYNENKNNTVFAFCSELVMRGWFHTVELFYGPVGHTHNGNDGEIMLVLHYLNCFKISTTPGIVKKHDLNQ
jgi:hypothetical protein